MHPSNTSSRAAGIVVVSLVAGVTTGLGCGGNHTNPVDGTTGPSFAVQSFTSPNASGSDAGIDAGLYAPIPPFDAGNPLEALDAGFPIGTGSDAGTGPVRPLPGPVAGTFDAGAPALPLRADEPGDAGAPDAGDEFGLISPLKFLHGQRPVAACPGPTGARVRHVSTLDEKPLEFLVGGPESCAPAAPHEPRQSRRLELKPLR